jgi:predicted RNA binding protein YcfA (HicA-like mRNA interferase family)
MPELPSITGAEAVKAFGRAGFVVDRVCGSHYILKRPGHLNVLSVPVHGSGSLKRGTLRGLIRASGLSVEQFVELL